MLLVEADGKALFSHHGILVPAGVITTGGTISLPGDGPWMVKAQVPVGGRGKAGGIIRCASKADVDATVNRLLGSRIKSHRVDACLVECAVEGEERYISVTVDPPTYGLRVLFGAEGGVDIEAAQTTKSFLCAPHPGAVAEVLGDLLATEQQERRQPILQTGRALAAMLLEKELALAEINPLFLTASGCVAGDAKVVIDLNAIGRQPDLAAMIAARPVVYQDATRKLAEGFDYVELDPEGEIGLVTTGAGLSMMLIDELTARGAKPLNFCDIRTGQMRGSPARLIRVLEWITAHASLKAVLVNIFAGITDLSEFANLLSAAIKASPALHVPVVARLVGRNATQAREILNEAQPGLLVTEDLNEALSEIDRIVGRPP